MSMWKLSPPLASGCLVYIYCSGGIHGILFPKSILSFFLFNFFFLLSYILNTKVKHDTVVEWNQSEGGSFATF